MKVLQLPYRFYPDPPGGTEVYVEGLVRALRARGVESVVAAPGQREESYDYQGIGVRRFAVSPKLPLEQLYGADKTAAESFARLLDREKPAIVHLHAFTSAVSALLLREAKKRGARAVFTYHTPTVSCQRGTLLRWGNEVCDGTLRLDLCTRCTLQGLGVARPAAELVGRIPAAAGRLLGASGLSGGAWTALRMRELMRIRHANCRELFAEADRIVAVSDWVKELLLSNGVPQDKMVLSRQGITAAPPVKPPASGRNASPRVAWFGRFDSTKGVHTLVKALRTERELKLQLDLYGISQGASDEAYRARVQAAAEADPRIRFLRPVPSAEVPQRLAEYDLLAVPSEWLESGPLVVLEAFAAGVPVIGSKLGGIAELVRDGVDGLLVAPGSLADWRRQLRRISGEPELIRRLRSGVRPPRTIDEAAHDMERLYASLA